MAAIDPVTGMTLALQLIKGANLLIASVQQEGGLTEEQKAQVRANVQSANDAWEAAVAARPGA